MTLLDLTPFIGAGGMVAMIVACLAAMLALWKYARNVHRAYWSAVLLLAMVLGLFGYVAMRIAHEAIAHI